MMPAGYERKKERKKEKVEGLDYGEAPVPNFVQYSPKGVNRHLSAESYEFDLSGKSPWEQGWEKTGNWKQQRLVSALKTWWRSV